MAKKKETRAATTVEQMPAMPQVDTKKLYEMLRELSVMQEQKKALEKRVEACKAELKDAFVQPGAVDLENGWMGCWKTTVSMRFSAERAKMFLTDEQIEACKAEVVSNSFELVPKV